MPRCYIVGDIEVTDPDRYKDYSSHTEETLAPYGGHFLVRGGETEVLEGDWQPHRLVVIEFPDIRDARGWYTGDRYRKILPIRHEASTGGLALVEGYRRGG